jgi:CheY-like chemotaxis protein
VDDDRIGRRLLRSRFSRIFPEAIIEEVESGENAIEKTEREGIFYDIIFMDHFMAINEMNGDETIRELRKRNVDSLIIGISGNFKENEHVSAGADSFFQKPIPSNEILMQGLLSRLPPPAGWNALVVDDVKLNSHFIARKLQMASSPHFTNLEVAKKRWSISSCTSGVEAMDLIKTTHLDLLVLDQNLGNETIRGTDIALFAKENSLNKDVVIILNTGSELKQPEGEQPFHIYWPKPLPSVEQMRRNLTRELVKSRVAPDESREKG